MEIKVGSRTKYRDQESWGNDIYTVKSIVGDRVEYEDGGFDYLKDLELAEPNKEDAVAAPSTKDYYNGMEVFDQMLKIYGVEFVKGFCICNSFKYRQRAGKKSENIEEDIKKALWYEERFKELNK